MQSQAGSPRVLSVASEPRRAHIVLGVSTGLCWFRGHFPDMPILPGVVQLHWAILACRALYGFTGSPKEIKRLKFKKIVEPPAEIELAITRLGEREAKFAISSAGSRHCEGTIVFPEVE
jgi:3-hydroxymyristoyl/3-hydroxydecanoyl-(acyl carrier protein) dehydratase